MRKPARPVSKIFRRNSIALHRTAKEAQERLWARRRALWRDDPVAAVRTLVDDLLENRDPKRTALVAGSTAVVLLLGLSMNAVSAFIMLCSGLGVVAGHLLRSEKGTAFSAVLLLFGVMSIWIAPVREAVLGAPFTTLGALLCAAAAFRFASLGWAAMMTGGALSIAVMLYILGQARQPESGASLPSPPVPAPSAPMQSGNPDLWYAEKGKTIDLQVGTPYRFNFTTGAKTTLHALSGRISVWRDDRIVQPCDTKASIRMSASKAEYEPSTLVLRSCDGDARVSVADVQ